jgi:nucleotide-binding universal stress UspA family protein
MIISSHGFSGIGYILLGGTAERVVRHVNCPVLVLNKREDIVVDPRRIVVPVDFSPASIDGLRYALGFAHLFSAEITVMHVISPASLTDWMADGLQGYEYEQGERAKSKLSDLEKSVNSPGRSFQTVFRHGVPYHEIVQKAAKAKYDLIILGSNGSGGLVDTLLGSTAERVIHHAPCPVLVVRRSASSD